MIRKRLLLLVLLTFALALAAATALAQTGGGFDLAWSSVDGGGGVASGGSYTLNGTVGQADAGALSGGGYTLAGGFWGGGAADIPITGGNLVYLPLVTK